MIEAAVKRRQPLPDAIQNAPTLLPGLEHYFEAFMELTTCRDTAFEVGRLPWTAIDAYGRRYGYEDEEFDYLLGVIRAMDNAYVEWAKEKQAKPTPPPPASTPPRTRKR